jgi:hypothetical protein
MMARINSERPLPLAPRRSAHAPCQGDRRGAQRRWIRQPRQTNTESLKPSIIIQMHSKSGLNWTEALPEQATSSSTKIHSVIQQILSFRKWDENY